MQAIRKNRTGYKGIKETSAKRFQAYLCIASLGGRTNRVRITKNIGTFDTPQEAYIARINFIDNLK